MDETETFLVLWFRFLSRLNGCLTSRVEGFSGVSLQTSWERTSPPHSLKFFFQLLAGSVLHIRSLTMSVKYSWGGGAGAFPTALTQRRQRKTLVPALPHDLSETDFVPLWMKDLAGRPVDRVRVELANIPTVGVTGERIRTRPFEDTCDRA